MRLRSGLPEPAEISGETALLCGRVPISGINGYAAELASYTGGRGRLSLEPDGYDECVSPEKVIAEYAYDSEADLENTPDSVFCAHGGGFTVKWDKVKDYMHLESCLRKEPEAAPRVNRMNLHIDEKELEAIMLREFGPIKRPLYRMSGVSYSAKEEAQVEINPRRKWFVIDGYNLIFALDEFAAIAAEELAAARDALVHELSNFAAFTGCELVLVFDAYKQPGNPGQRFSQAKVKVVYTREGETGDMYIEKLVGEIGKNDLVRVVSSDSLIQLSSFRSGVLRMSSKEFEAELNRVNAEIERILASQKREKTTLADALNAAQQNEANHEKE
jgi:predicted RNA-binding protein with PIN domain